MAGQWPHVSGRDCNIHYPIYRTRAAINHCSGRSHWLENYQAMPPNCGTGSAQRAEKIIFALPKKAFFMEALPGTFPRNEIHAKHRVAVVVLGWINIDLCFFLGYKFSVWSPSSPQLEVGGDGRPVSLPVAKSGRLGCKRPFRISIWKAIVRGIVQAMPHK